MTNEVKVIDYHTTHLPTEEYLSGGNVFSLIEVSELGWVDVIEVVKSKDVNMFYIQENKKFKGLFTWELLIEKLELYSKYGINPPPWMCEEEQH